MSMGVEGAPAARNTTPHPAGRALAPVRAELASFKVPRGVVRVDALPRNAMGKVQRHLLPAWTPPGAP